MGKTDESQSLGLYGLMESTYDSIYAKKLRI